MGHAAESLAEGDMWPVGRAAGRICSLRSFPHTATNHRKEETSYA